MAERKHFFLRRILEILREDLGGAGVSLLANSELSIPATGVPEDSYRASFMGYDLFVGKRPDEISPNDKISIKSAERLANVILPRVHSSARARQGEIGSIGVGQFLSTLHEILKVMESRSILVDNYEKIIQLNRQILMAEDLQAALQVIMDMSRTALGGEGSSLLLVDPRSAEMYFTVVGGSNEDELKEIRIPSGRGIAGSVVASARAEIIRDVKSDSRTFHSVDETLGKQTRDMVIAPIMARGQVIGVIEVINSLSPYGFLHEDLDFLSNIASHTGLLIENARSKQDLLKINHELDRKIMEINALYESGKTMLSSLDLMEVKRNLLRSIMRMLRIGSGAILHPSYATRTLFIEYELEYSPEGIREVTPGGSFSEAGDLLTWLAEHKEPLLLKQMGSGMIQRFLESNRHLSDQNYNELWLPVAAAGNPGITFILALGDLPEKAPGNAFLKSVINQAQSAVHNIDSYNNALAAKQKENSLRRTFQKYVPDRVVTEVLEEKEAKGPQVQQIAVLFADIQGFTSLAESLDASLLVELLNEFFESMVEVVHMRGGIVDKFMGDSLMAVFGVPEPGKNDAGNALRAAREMHEALAVLNQDRRKRNRPLFGLSIGLNAGPALVGSIGSSQRMDYTAIGDTVNLASRLEKLNRYYQTGTLLSAEAMALAEAPEMPVTEIDLVTVYGKTKPTRIFELSQKPVLRDQEAFQRGLLAFRAGDFLSARKAFQELNGDDRIVEIYLERCQRLEKVRPENWDGVFALGPV